ncbi:MAG: hypothetical protein AAF318_01520 [Pseudomonadota bacterium]
MLTALDGGTYYHHRTLWELPFAPHFDAVIPIRAFTPDHLDAATMLFVPCRLNARLLEPLRPVLTDFIIEGGTLVAMGETFPERWLPGITAHPMETSFWWWLEEGADLHVRFTGASQIADYVDEAALAWHLHGTYTLGPGQRALLEASGRPILFDERRGNGRLIATSLDPCYHHGSHFMPATTRFLEGFLPWLSAGAP